MGFTKKEMEEQGFTTEQINWAMAERGKEINDSKAKLDELQVKLTEKENAITELSEKAKSLDGTELKLKELNDQVAVYEKEKSDREETEKQAKLDSELKTRFDAIKGENKFSHELIENGRFQDFKKALLDEQFKGKGDSDIFSAIVKPEDLVNPQRQTVTMPGGGSTIPKDLAQAKTFDEYKAIRKASN